jgi:hypothetical protein
MVTEIFTNLVSLFLRDLFQIVIFVILDTVFPIKDTAKK